MDMNQGRVAPAAIACATGTVLLAAFVALDGANADLGHSLPLIVASVGVFVLPGCIGAAFSAWRSRAVTARIDHREAMAVMRDVAPLEAESMPLAEVLSLTEVHVERRQRERRATARQAEIDTMAAS